MYEKLGLVEESDLEKYRKKLGLQKGIDLAEIDLDDVDAMLEIGAQKQITGNGDPLINPKKKQSRIQKLKKDFDREEFKKIVGDIQTEKVKLSEMDEEERA